MSAEPQPTSQPPPPAPPRHTAVFRWSGAYWGYVRASRLLDRHGRDVGWLEPTPSQVPRWRGRRGDAPKPSGFDVFLRDGHFLGEVCSGHYVLRNEFRGEPVPRAPRPAIPDEAPPDPSPDREERDPVDGWREALPWPLRPPDALRF